MDTKLLKQKILDLAIRGKLVPQNPADEPASVLLERIKAEKAQLIKEGKIKKEKPLPPIEEVPFEIPESWEWTTIGDFTGDLKYGTAEKSLPEGKVAVLRMGNITRDGSIDYSDLVYTNNESDIEKYILKEGDILFNRTNSSEWVGKCAIYHDGIPAIYAGYIIRFTPIGLNSEYINYVMISKYERDYCAKVKTDGINQSNINSVKLAKLQIPIPPLEEQKRIVAEIDRWFKCIDELEKNQQDLHTAIQQAKSKILDLAIHGKLVPQESEWKERPFFDVAKLLYGYPFNSNLFNLIKEGTPLIRIRDVVPAKTETYTTEIVDDRYLVHKGEMLVGMDGNFNIGFWNGEDAYLNQRVVKITAEPDLIIQNYLSYQLQAKLADIENNVSYSTVKHLSNKHFVQMTIPSPDLTEQKKIVNCVEELFAQLDKIEESLI